MPDLPALVSGLSTAPALLPTVVLMSGLGPTEVPSVMGIVLAPQQAIVLMWWSWRAAPARRRPGAPAGRESEAPPEPADAAPPSETPEPADAASPSGTPKPAVRERALEAAEAADAAPTSETPEPADAAPESEVPAADAAPTPLRRAGGQLIGAREAQEDEFGFIDGSTLDHEGRHPVVIVADGMGGHAGGEMASRLAVRAFVDAYGLDGAPADRLRAALDAANRSIDDAVCENLSLDGMGATLVAATVTTDGLEWISVGDSPLYLYRAGRLKRLNEDHSMAPVIEALRESDPATARGMNPNELRSALVGFEIAKVDASPMPELLLPGDLIVAATDGLNTLSVDETASIVSDCRDDGPEAVTDALLAAVAARAVPTQDNATVAIIEIPDRLS